MAHPAIIPAVVFCTTINPAIDKVAGAFPKLLPLAIAVTATDLVCAVVNPTVWGVIGLIADVAQVRVDLRARTSSSNSKTLGMRR